MSPVGALMFAMVGCAIGVPVGVAATDGVGLAVAVAVAVGATLAPGDVLGVDAAGAQAAMSRTRTSHASFVISCRG
jgi:hypothetical protein